MEKAQPRAPELSHLRNRHRGERILVCGLGPSLKELPALPNCLTIGVNDIFRWHAMDYLLVLDPPSSFDRDGPERKEAIIASRPRKALVLGEGFHEHWRPLLQIPWVLAPLAPIQAQNMVPPFLDARHQLHKVANSPGTAASLAAFLGARSVGLIGVDLIDHPRIQGPMIRDIDVNGYARLAEFLKMHECALVNLSPVSAIKSLPYLPLDEWLAS